VTDTKFTRSRVSAPERRSETRNNEHQALRPRRDNRGRRNTAWPRLPSSTLQELLSSPLTSLSSVQPLRAPVRAPIDW